MPDAPAFAEAMARGPLVLDGGLGTLLEAQGHDLSSSLWSARLLRDDPDAVRRAHAEFLDAGADVVINASYQVGYDTLGAVGATTAEVDALLRTSVQLAREAVERQASRRGFVAASVGPYGATRADGSEYTGEYGKDAVALRDWHRRRLHVLADAGPDVLAIETIPSAVEVEAICAELAGLGVPAWISLSASSPALPPDERARALAIAADVPEVIAVGVNCCPPALVADALADAPAGVPTVAYPNSGEIWDAVGRRWIGDAGVSVVDASAWVTAGARLVGGCCRTTPAHIARLAAALRPAA